MYHACSVCLVACLSVCLSVCVSACLCFCVSVLLSVSLSVVVIRVLVSCLLACLSLCLLSVLAFVCAYVCVSTCLWACLCLFVCLLTISSLLYQTRCCTMLPVLASLPSFRLAALSPCDWLVHCGRPRTCLRFNCHWEHSPTLVALVDVESPYKG